MYYANIIQMYVFKNVFTSLLFIFKVYVYLTYKIFLVQFIHCFFPPSLGFCKIYEYTNGK